MQTTTTPNSDRTVADLIRELRDETSLLVKQEIALVQTEMSEKTSRFTRNAVYLAVGGLVAFSGFIFVLLALSILTSVGLEGAGVDPELAFWLGPGIVGLVIAIVGYALVQKAISTFSKESFTPEKTIRTLKEDKQWAQEKFSRA